MRTCPKCGRAVPRRVPSCRCGYEMTAADVPAVPAARFAASVPVAVVPAVAVPVHRTPLVLGMAAMIVVLTGVAGGLWWRSAKAQAAAAASADTTSADVAALVKAAAAASASASTSSTGNPPPPPTIPSSDAAPLLSIEELVTRTMPAVVTVETPTGTGSGFFVSADTVITNKHVVESETMVNLRSSTGGRVAARVESSSWEVDIAVLKVSVANPAQVFLPLAVPSDVHQGEEVIAIGSPIGLRNSVTRGIVSGTRQDGGVSLVQTDAAINPGNSGGPLIDRQGRVIGINTWKIVSEGLESIGFAVSVYHARRMLGADFALNAEREYLSQQQAGQYEKEVAALASSADEVEERWKGFRSSCFANPDATAAGAREWFALAEGGSFTLHDVARCTSWREYFAESARRMRDGLAAAKARAGATPMSIDTSRRVRRKYKMLWPEWDR
jgi:S1-C subfamily serine protease